MIVGAFDMKFDEKKHEIPPEACRPLKKLQKKPCPKSEPPKSEKSKKLKCARSGSPASPPERDVREAAAPQEKKGCFRFIRFDA